MKVSWLMMLRPNEDNMVSTLAHSSQLVTALQHFTTKLTDWPTSQSQPSDWPKVEISVGAGPWEAHKSSSNQHFSDLQCAACQW